MRRIGTRESRFVPIGRLYLSDYSGLMEILQRDTFEVEVSADEYKLDNPDEIKQLKKATVRELLIVSTSSPSYKPLEGKTSLDELIKERRFSYNRLSVNINGTGASVWFAGAPDPQYTKALEILDFFMKRRSRWRTFNKFANVSKLLLLFILVTVSLLFAAARQLLSLFQFEVVYGACFLFRMFMILISHVQRKAGIALALKERAEEGSFYQRHKELLEKLSIGVGSAIAGALVKAIFEKK